MPEDAKENVDHAGKRAAQGCAVGISKISSLNHAAVQHASGWDFTLDNRHMTRAHIHSHRRAVGNRFLIDPIGSRIVEVSVEATVSITFILGGIILAPRR